MTPNVPPKIWRLWPTPLGLLSLSTNCQHVGNRLLFASSLALS